MLTKQTLLILSLFFVLSTVCADSEKTLAEKLKDVEALVVSDPAQALAVIDSLKIGKSNLTIRQKVKLIRHEVVANTYLNRHKLALEIIEELKKISALENDKSILWQYYNVQAIVYWHMDSVEESLNAHLKAYDVVKSIDEFREIQGISEGNIGYAFIKLGFFKQAITYLESALELALMTDDVIVLASSYNNLGEAYLGLKNFKKSTTLLEKSLTIRLEHKLTFHSSFSYQNIGLLYYAQQQYPKAELAFIKAIEIRQQANFIKGVLVSKLALVKVYIASNQITLAEQEIATVIVSANKQKNLTNLSEAYNLQAQIFAIKKDYQSAYQASLLYQQTLELVVLGKTSEKLAGYLITSTAISKDLNILELKKNAEIKELQVNSEKQKIKIILISSLSMLVILIIFLWTIQKSKKVIAKSNANLSLTLAQLQQTQEELVKAGKISALTTLVSRMAHQVNTPLGIAVTGVSHIHEKAELFSELIQRGEVKKTEIDSFMTDLNRGCELSSNSMNKVAGLVSQFKVISENLEAEAQQEFEIFTHISKHVDLILGLLKYEKPIIDISGSQIEIVGYPEALNKVLSQLISNSIDHAFAQTLSPEIQIAIAKVSEQVEITYQDNGKGIDAELVNDVFEPFNNTTMSNKNLGIGLSIAYNLVVQLMQGNIQCTPKKGKGIMFILTLPLKVDVS